MCNVGSGETNDVLADYGNSPLPPSMLARYAGHPYARQLARRGAYAAGRFVRRQGLSLARKVLNRSIRGRRGRPVPRGRRSKRRGASMMQGIGQKRTVKVFKLCHQFVMTGDGTNATQDLVFRLSDPTDVEGLAGADQPTGWQEWSAFYEHAKVISCWVKFLFTNVSTVHTTIRIGLHPDVDNTSLQAVGLGWTEWCEYPRTQTRRLETVDLDAGTGSLSKSISMKYGCKPSKLFQQTFKNQRFEILMPDTSSTDVVHMHVLMSGQREGVNPITQIVECTAVFHWKVLFYDRRNLAKSVDA